MRWLAHGRIPVLGFGALFARGSLLVGAPRVLKQSMAAEFEVADDELEEEEELELAGDVVLGVLRSWPPSRVLLWLGARAIAKTRLRWF